MTSLDFLYIALGSGFLLLVVFLCAMLLNLTIILRDVVKITDNAKVVSDKIKETVLEPFKAVSEMTATMAEVISSIRHKFEDSQSDHETETKGESTAKKGVFKSRKIKK